MAFSPDKEVITGDKPNKAFLKLLFSSKQVVHLFAIFLGQWIKKLGYLEYAKTHNKLSILLLDSVPSKPFKLSYYTMYFSHHFN